MDNAAAGDLTRVTPEDLEKLLESDGDSEPMGLGYLNGSIADGSDD
ncbi:hypothetical protein [Microlunatus soli]|uniref:Uncharacterized protein n=1 Tax=Microlunatus soli TaxID=630515 RepID=A0A1H1YUU0_9ACTN|nr:hypothetical protein [Microlunatus soli]SDT25295.1 hypothetical protein SAMN04489812_4801 [Microlunatus soli]